MAKQNKKISNIDFHRAFVAQLDKNLDKFVGECQGLNPDADAEASLEQLKGYVVTFVEDVKHYIENFKMTDGIVNVNEDGKPALRGNQNLVEEQAFFKANATQSDPTKSRPFIPYKEYVRKVMLENTRREKVGLKPLADIASPTYESWKTKFK